MVIHDDACFLDVCEWKKRKWIDISNMRSPSTYCSFRCWTCSSRPYSLSVGGKWSSNKNAEKIEGKGIKGFDCCRCSQERDLHGDFPIQVGSFGSGHGAPSFSNPPKGVSKSSKLILDKGKQCWLGSLVSNPFSHLSLKQPRFDAIPLLPENLPKDANSYLVGSKVSLYFGQQRRHINSCLRLTKAQGPLAALDSSPYILGWTSLLSHFPPHHIDYSLILLRPLPSFPSSFSPAGQNVASPKFSRYLLRY